MPEPSSRQGFGSLCTSPGTAGRGSITATSRQHLREVEMMKLALPIALAIVSMGIAMIVVLALRPELRTELVRLRKPAAIELETD